MKRERIVLIVLALASLASLIFLNPMSSTLNAQGDQTQQNQTIDAIINPRLTLTGLRAQELTATSLILDTAAYSVFQSQTAMAQTFTPTPSNTDPGYTHTPINQTQRAQTALAGANQLLTLTNSLQITNEFELTVNAIINQTLGVTETPIPTNTPPPSYTPSITQTQPTPNATQTYQTLIAVINGHLTETPEAQIAQTVTAVFKGTIQFIVDQQATQTAAVVQAIVANGYDEITAQNAAKLTAVKSVDNHGAGVNDVAISPDGTEFAAANTDNTVRVWDTLTGAEIATFNGLTDRLSISFSPDGAYLAAASSDNTVRLWDLATKRELPPLQGHLKGVIRAAFNPNNTMLVSISNDRTIRLWSLPDFTSVSVKQPGLAVALAFSPDGLRFITGGSDASITSWESTTGIKLAALRDAQGITALTFSPDGKFIASVGSGYFATIWDGAAGKKIRSLRGPTRPLTSVAFCHDDSCLMAASKDGSLWLWNAQTGDKIATFAPTKNSINGIAMSSDGRRLITAGADTTLTIWGIPSGS